MKFRELDEFLARVWEDICALNAQYRLIPAAKSLDSPRGIPFGPVM